MAVDGFAAQLGLSGNHLRGFALLHPCQDLTFSLRQKFQLGPDLCHPGSPFLYSSALFQSSMNLVEKGLATYGFLQEIESPLLEGLYCHRHVPMARDEYDWERVSSGEQFLLEPQTAYPRHPHVKRHAAMPVGPVGLAHYSG